MFHCINEIEIRFHSSQQISSRFPWTKILLIFDNMRVTQRESNANYWILTIKIGCTKTTFRKINQIFYYKPFIVDCRLLNRIQNNEEKGNCV